SDFLSLLLRRHLSSTLFPYTTLFRSEGFPLVGGRLDYLENRAVAALVYQRRNHVINLFIWPSSQDTHVKTKALARQGYHLVHWSDRKSTRLNSSHVAISYAVFCLKKK